MHNEKIERLIEEVIEEYKGGKNPIKIANEKAVIRIKIFVSQFDEDSPVDGLIAVLLHQVIARVENEIAKAKAPTPAHTVRIAANELMKISKQMMDTSAACEHVASINTGLEH